MYITNRFHSLPYKLALLFLVIICIKNPFFLVSKQIHKKLSWWECPHYNIQHQLIVETLCLLPGHGTFSLQTLESIGSPSHFLPPYCGVGELHWRVLDCFPCLQLFVHVLHSLHSPQFPSTEIKLSSISIGFFVNEKVNHVYCSAYALIMNFS